MALASASMFGTGPVKKSITEQRQAYLDANYPALPPDIHNTAASCEDAFDAAVSALAMARHAGELTALAQATDALTLLEGEIWRPECAPDATVRR